MNDNVIKVLGFGLLLTVAIGVAILDGKQDRAKIQGWADNNGYSVQEIDVSHFNYGPFWYCEDDQTIYKVKLIDKFENEKTSWFRIGFWGMDQEYE